MIGLLKKQQHRNKTVLFYVTESVLKCDKIWKNLKPLVLA